MKFLAIKLSALRSEIAVSREILQSASGEVDKMFNEKYFPEIPVATEESTETDLEAGTAGEASKTVHPEDIAMELGIEIPEITEYKLKQTEQKIIAIKKELNQIESTMVWHWFFTSENEQKTSILEKLFELMYANNPRP